MKEKHLIIRLMLRNYGRFMLLLVSFLMFGHLSMAQQVSPGTAQNSISVEKAIMKAKETPGDAKSHTKSSGSYSQMIAADLANPESSVARYAKLNPNDPSIVEAMKAAAILTGKESFKYNQSEIENLQTQVNVAYKISEKVEALVLRGHSYEKACLIERENRGKEQPSQTISASKLVLTK